MIELALILCFIAGAALGYRLGWNGALRMVRDRDIERAKQRFEADRK